MIRGMVCLLFLAAAGIADASDSCGDCHGDRRKMESFGAGGFVVAREESQLQTGMPASCSECHLGNPAAGGKEAAHRGMAKLLVVSKKGFDAITSPRKYPLEYGTNPVSRIYTLVEKDGRPVRDASVTALSWHDKNRETLSQDFAVMKKTCGACHAEEFAEFARSTMATNGKQSQYKGWHDPKRGPHNCGPWFDGNFAAMQAATALPMSQESHRINQKACNICHVGCLDCHFLPQKKNPADLSQGAHTFVKTPPAASCYGNGRASICHAGPEDRRRGAGYFGGSFSYPEGNPPDVHLAAKVGCLDCHASTKTDPKLGHAMVRRQAEASCKRCHAEAARSHATSLHRNLACEACHIQNVAGYQATYWGPGNLAGAATPYFKFKAYYGYMPQPILIRDQRGRWIPVKPYPMAVMNQKESRFSPGLYWRYPANLPELERTDDAWAYVGLFGGMPENNRAMLWIQMDKMSHKLGRSRSCDSCHGSADGAQLQSVAWEYSDPGAFPFQGGHEVLADRNGIFIRKMQSETIVLEPGFTLSALAPWVYFKDSWQVKGDFSLPVIRDRQAFEAVNGKNEAARSRGILHR